MADHTRAFDSVLSSTVLHVVLGHLSRDYDGRRRIQSLLPYEGWGGEGWEVAVRTTALTCTPALSCETYHWAPTFHW